MGYGKIGNDNQLMSTQVSKMGWIPLYEFVKDAEGNFYTHYLDPQTPDMETINANATELSYQELMKQLEGLTVDYMDHTFSGNTEAQAYLVAMLTKIEGENPQATRKVYSIDGRTTVPMTKSDMLDLISLIDIAQEALGE